jgi:hypothetical protein
MPEAAPDLQFILFKRRNGQFRLAACRGLNKGCAKLRSDKVPKKPCPDCVPCEDPNETLGQVMARISRGDA